ncbi:unnamed protein product [Paramecium sonneborni]|uniref:non-specific serine/threonine protein kinase n=1 Tax=Paramecium sonneborni TaxID=65129 RepID=A0A8S1LE04_9CILI|nr:unnamed protein product [Paramecium sonneborni]
MQANQSDVPKREILKILIAESSEFQRLAMSCILEFCGFQVIACRNGLEARDELLKNDNEVDLILLDLQIPIMGALELLTIIKNIDNLKEIPVIIMDVEAEQNIVAACLKAGAIDFLMKPISFENFKSFNQFVKKKPKINDNNQNNKEKYTIVRKIGRGNTSSVELVRNSTNQELYAMKIIPLYLMNEQERKYAENEANVLRVLTAPTIIKYYESFTENKSLNIVMEYAEGGSLNDKISEYSRQGIQIPKDQILAWLAQLVIAINFMHSKNIIHRDIKTQNILLNKEQVIKLGNFETSKQIGSDIDFEQPFFGTPYYISPEILGGQPHGKKSDIWGLGCILYELIMLKRPFQSNEIEILFEMILNKPYDMDPSVDQDFQQIIEKTLQKDPKNRPTIEDLAAIPCIHEKINQFYKDHPNEK